MYNHFKARFLEMLKRFFFNMTTFEQAPTEQKNARLLILLISKTYDTIFSCTLRFSLVCCLFTCKFVSCLFGYGTNVWFLAASWNKQRVSWFFFSFVKILCQKCFRFCPGKSFVYLLILHQGIAPNSELGPPLMSVDPYPCQCTSHVSNKYINKWIELYSH